MTNVEYVKVKTVCAFELPVDSKQNFELAVL